jgi:hypothetical protein
MIETPNSTDSIMDDASLIKRAEEFYGEERMLKAAEVLKQVKDQENLFTDRHKMIIRWAGLVEIGIEEMLQDPEKDGSPWTKQKEKHGNRDFLIFYQVTEENQLIARIDCAIESSLLVPLLSVFNETELFSSWMPSWKKPIKLGVTLSEKLKEEGRGKQIVHVRTALGWPLKERDLIMRVMAVDAIEDDHGCIAIQALNQTSEDDPVIPVATKDTVQMDFDDFMMIRACPSDHPCLTRSKHQNDRDKEPQILLSCSMKVDPHVNAVPKAIQNFCARTVVGRMWSSTLHVAEDVRDGKRPMHKKAIDAKRELYDWIDERAAVMINNLEKTIIPIQSS